LKNLAHTNSTLLTNISARGGGQRKKGKKKNRKNKKKKLFKNLSTHLTKQEK